VNLTAPLLQPIETLLIDRGFTKPAPEAGHSSGGAFQAATFRRGALEVGLVVRNGNALGCPNYSYGAGYVGHEDVIAALGRLGEERLVPGQYLAYKARDGGDPFDALYFDLREIILPVLDRSEDDFRLAIDKALRQLRERRGW
jgi:hypothetical protein